MPGCLMGWVRGLGLSPSHPCFSFPQCLGGTWCLAVSGHFCSPCYLWGSGPGAAGHSRGPGPPRGMWYHRGERPSSQPWGKAWAGDGAGAVSHAPVGTTESPGLKEGHSREPGEKGS